MQGIVASRILGVSATPSRLGFQYAQRGLATVTNRSYGGLSDQDRIFQNLYGHHDFGLKGAMVRLLGNQDADTRHAVIGTVLVTLLTRVMSLLSTRSRPRVFVAAVVPAFRQA